MKNIAIIGIGGAGVNFLDRIINNMYKWYKINITYAFISYDIEEIHKIQKLGVEPSFYPNDLKYEPIVNRTITRKINYIAIGKDTCRGSISRNTESMHKAWDESKSKVEEFLSKLTKNVDLVITVAAIGGAAGTGITPLVNEYIKSLKIPIVTFVQRPASFEGKRRRDEIFNKNISLFKNSANECFILDAKNIKMDFFYKCDLKMAEEIRKYLILKCNLIGKEIKKFIEDNAKGYDINYDELKVYNLNDMLEMNEFNNKF